MGKKGKRGGRVTTSQFTTAFQRAQLARIHDSSISLAEAAAMLHKTTEKGGSFGWAGVPPVEDEPPPCPEEERPRRMI